MKAINRFNFVLAATFLLGIENTPAVAQQLPSDSFTLRLVETFCGSHENADGSQISCYCGDRIGYIDQGGTSTQCGGKSVPNLYAMDVEAGIKFLGRVMYGSRFESEGFNRGCNGNDCDDIIEVFAAIRSDDEAYYVGHFVAAVLGEEGCEAAISATNTAWAEDTALAGASFASLTGADDVAGLENAKNEFSRGCARYYGDVWNWMKQVKPLQ